MSTKHRTYRQEKLARIYDREILPVWSNRFGRLLLRNMKLPERAQVLDVACGTGYPAIEILSRLGSGRLIAIDASSAMLDVARKKIAEMNAKGVFFRTESAVPRLSFADDVYDMVVCNLGLGDMPDPARAIADFARVTKPGGEVRCTLPLEGTFQEFHDIYREVLTKHDRHAALERLTLHLEESYPSVTVCEEWLQRAGLEEPRVEIDRFTMLFRSSREFFFAPVIEYGPLPAWRELAGTGQELQDTFWYIKEAIDAYFEGRAFAVTVVAGCLIGRKGTAPVAVSALPAQGAQGADPTGEIELHTNDISLEDVSGMSADDHIEEEIAIADDVALDAFVEGKRRPSHLE